MAVGQSTVGGIDLLTHGMEHAEVSRSFHILQVQGYPGSRVFLSSLEEMVKSCLLARVWGGGGGLWVLVAVTHPVHTLHSGSAGGAPLLPWKRKSSPNGFAVKRALSH